MPQSSKTSPGKLASIEPFKGRRRFFVSMKKAGGDISPIQNHAFGGIPFQAFTQSVVDMQDGSGNQQLSAPLGGTYVMLTWSQIQKAAESIQAFRIRRIGRRCLLISLASQRAVWSEKERCHVRTQYRYYPQDGDEPVAKYLVLLPAETVERSGGREYVEKMPSMLDRDPCLGEYEQEPETALV